MKKILLAVSVGLMFTISCSKTKEITPAEFFAKADSLVVKGAYTEAISYLSEFEKKYPKDTANICESYRMIADIYAGKTSQFQKGIEYYNKIIQTYPDRPEAMKSLFKVGFTYEDHLKDLENAKKIYEGFLKKYPYDSLAISVKFSLDHLGESEEDVIQRLLKQNASK